MTHLGDFNNAVLLQNYCVIVLNIMIYRIDYHSAYLSEVWRAIENGVTVRGNDMLLYLK